MIGNYHENMSVQAYFEYDAKKSSGWTISHLRFSPDVQIEAPFRIEDSQGDYVACHNESYVQANKYDVIRFLKRRGTFFLNTAVAAIQDPTERMEALEQIVSHKILRNLALRNIKVCGSLSSLMFRHRTLLISFLFAPLKVLYYGRCGPFQEIWSCRSN
jgi:Pyruvate/2-oxoacid:ferredoxin oxidoreductase gamma subunit